MNTMERCKKHIANPLIEINGVPTCFLCGPQEPEQKQQDTKKKKNPRLIADFSEVSCTLCKKVKKRRKLSGYDYVDEAGNKWLRRRCPECRPTMIYKQNIKRERRLEDFVCQCCSKSFRPRHVDQVYCSPECKEVRLPLTTVSDEEFLKAANKVSEQYKNTFQNLAKEETQIQKTLVITRSYK